MILTVRVSYYLEILSVIISKGLTERLREFSVTSKLFKSERAYNPDSGIDFGFIIH